MLLSSYTSLLYPISAALLFVLDYYYGWSVLAKTKRLSILSTSSLGTTLFSRLADMLGKWPQLQSKLQAAFETPAKSAKRVPEEASTTSHIFATRCIPYFEPSYQLATPHQGVAGFPHSKLKKRGFANRFDPLLRMCTKSCPAPVFSCPCSSKIGRFTADFCSKMTEISAS